MVNQPFVEIPGLSVDSFDMNSRSSSVFFLTHCHRDHFPAPDCGGRRFLEYIIEEHYYVYMSEITMLILRNDCGPEYVKNIRIIEPNKPVDIAVTFNSETILVNATAIPAGHCPGSVMFLFCCSDGRNIIHTGDFRISPRDLHKFKQFQDCNGDRFDIDCVYLDTTFYNNDYEYFPSRADSIAAICDLVKEWTGQGEDYIVELFKPAGYGSEYIFVDISKKLEMLIWAPEDFLHTYRCIPEFDGVFTNDKTNCRIVVKGGTNYTEKKCIISPTALRWRNWQPQDKVYVGQGKYYRVCYSSHCSRHELIEFIRYIKPKKVVPFVTSGNEEEDRIMAKQLSELCTSLRDNLLIPAFENSDIKLSPPKKLKKYHKKFLNSFKKTSIDNIPQSLL